MFFALANVDASNAVDAVSAVAGAWSPGPLYVALQPYILTAFGVLFTALFGWLCALLQKHTGIVIAQNARDEIQTAAMNAAGRVMAAQDDRFASMRFEIDNKAIAAEVPVVAAAAAGAIKTLGITPASVGALIQGKVGQLQAQAQSVAPTAPTVVEVKP